MMHDHIFLQEDPGADIREWSPSRVNKFLVDFAERNKLKLCAPVPRLSGKLLENLMYAALFDIFEDASDIDVVNLYYQIHPTEVTLEIQVSFLVIPWFGRTAEFSYYLFRAEYL